MTSPISTAATDLITKVKTVAALNQRVGITSGGSKNDPEMIQAPRPSAWIVFTGDVNTSPGQPACEASLQLTFIVKVLLDYKNDTDILTNQLPILSQIQKTVHGSTAPNGMKWQYNGQSIEEMTDRLVYAQQYSLNVSS